MENKIFTRTNILIFSGVGAFLSLASIFSRLSGFCSGYEPNCQVPYLYLGLSLLTFVPFFFIALTSQYFLVDFTRWAKISTFLVLGLSLITFFLPSYISGEYYVHTTEEFTLVSTAIFILVSIGIILVQWWKNKMR